MSGVGHDEALSRPITDQPGPRRPEPEPEPEMEGDPREESCDFAWWYAEVLCCISCGEPVDETAFDYEVDVVFCRECSYVEPDEDREVGR